IATARFKKNMRRHLVILAVVACVMMIPIYGPVWFWKTNTLHSPFGWPWIVSFLGGVFLVLSAFSGRR
ncbi:MAG: hypothetical protein QNM00_08405, partial [Gammaproteobacteria bacterium]|nr:hypothetical protein [Gammaproteobacteria bacterium]